MAKPLTSAQIRAARALLRWSAEDLARQSLLSVATIRRAELTEGNTSMTAANDLAVRRALEAAGVESSMRMAGVRACAYDTARDRKHPRRESRPKDFRPPIGWFPEAPRVNRTNIRPILFKRS
jgi:transcriptional regulator with XRE-family HTH domain